MRSLKSSPSSPRRQRAIVVGGVRGSEVIGRASAEAAREVIRAARRYGIPIVSDPRLVQELAARPDPLPRELQLQITLLASGRSR